MGLTDVTLAQQTALFRGLADPNRLAIIRRLLAGPTRVSDIVDATGLAQPNVSAHLACLWRCGLVTRRRRGREVHYRLTSGVADILTAAEAVLTHAGAAVSGCDTFGEPGRTGDGVGPLALRPTP